MRRAAEMQLDSAAGPKHAKCHTTANQPRTQIAPATAATVRCRSFYRRCHASGLAGGGRDTTLKGLRRYNCKWSLKSKAQHRLSWKLNLSWFGQRLDPATRACPDRGSQSGSPTAAYKCADKSTDACACTEGYRYTHGLRASLLQIWAAA